MKILIAGSDLNTILLAKYIKLQNPESDIYITSVMQSEGEFYTSINIRENNINELCDFVKYNQIEFTIVISQLSIINGIADVFKKEGFPIFAPFAESARVTYFNSISKKIMYKLKINTPKFGIFDRENIALDYVRHSKFPIVIENDFTLFSRENKMYKTFLKAKKELKKIFENNNEKIIIQNYIDSEALYIYFITDGFNALPLITIERNEGKNYYAATAPSQKLPDNTIINILHKAIYPLLDDISKFSANYTGIIGVKLKLKNNNFYVLEFYNGFQKYDLQLFLSLLDEDILKLLYDTVNGSLADNHSCVHLSSQFGYTAAVDKKELIISGKENEFIECEDEEKVILTNSASTVNYARETLYEYLKLVCKEKLYKEIIYSEKKKECRI